MRGEMKWHQLAHLIIVCPHTRLILGSHHPTRPHSTPPNPTPSGPARRAPGSARHTLLLRFVGALLPPY